MPWIRSENSAPRAERMTPASTNSIRDPDRATTAHPQASVDGRPIALQPDRADPARLSFRVPTGTHQVLLVGAFAVDGLIIE